MQNIHGFQNIFIRGSGDSQKISEFAYQSSSDKAIKTNQILRSSDNSSATLYYNTFGDKLESSEEPTSFVIANNQKLTGKWIVARTALDITSDSDGKLLNSSIYGPCDIH